MDKPPKKDHPGGPPHSPRSGTSSNASTPSTKKLDSVGEKPSTPISKPVTPTSAAGSSSGGGGSGGGLKPVVKPPALGQYPPYLAMSNGKRNTFTFTPLTNWQDSRSMVC